MNDYEHRWSRTNYPKRCPECGGATAVARPDTRGLLVFVWILFVVLFGKGVLDTRQFGTAKAFAPSLFAAVAVLAGSFFGTFRPEQVPREQRTAAETPE